MIACGKSKKPYIFRNFDRQAFVLVILAALIGILVGLFAVLFRSMIGWSHEGFYGLSRTIFRFLPNNLWFILVPALAGLLVGPLTCFVANETKGSGIPEVMEAVALRGGLIRFRVAFIKAVAAAASIGAGASAGREGPIVQIGSGVGSSLSVFLRQNQDNVKTGVGCGAAAGIAATFNAPIAGVMFAQEIILGRFTATTFIPLVISSVTSSVVARIFLGTNPAFSVPAYALNHSLELVFYVFLGILSALAGVLFAKTLYKTADLFQSLKVIPECFHPVLGGVFIGLIGLIFPQVLGVGYETIEAAFDSRLMLGTLIALVFVKILATSLTIGSGYSGGVFAPSLFIGAALGGAWGTICEHFFPGIVINPGAYAVVGMGAVVAGATHTPITSIIMIFEMTRDYSLILPLMISVVISSLFFSHLNNGSIYTMKLLRRGINIEEGRDMNLMKTIKVKEVMTSPVETINHNDTLEKVIEKMHNTKHNSFPVLDEEKELRGIITLQDIREAPVTGIMELPVHQVMSTKLITVTPEDPVDMAFRAVRKNDLGHLPVVSAENPRKLVGIITRSDLIKAYDRQLIKK